jgi:cytidylate kinase
MQPEDSHLIDTSDLSVEQVIEKILALAGKKRGGH